MTEEHQSVPPKEGGHPSGLDTLEDRLYSRTPPPVRHDTEISSAEQHIRIAPDWTEEAERKESAIRGILGKIMPWLKHLFIASIIFVLLAAGVALYGFWRGGNIVSPQNISLILKAPVSAPAGEELTFDVTITNRNEIPLEAMDLLVEYPGGSRKPSDVSEELLRYRENLGTVAAEASLSRTLSFVPFGEEGEKKKIRVTIEYRPKDSNAIFPQSTEHEFVISAAPITVSLSAPKEVNSGQTFEISVEIVSNASAVIKNLMVKAEYPFGFEFSKSAPSPTFAKDTWLLGDILPKERRTVSISGRMESVEQIERALRLSIGTQSPKNEKSLGTVFLVTAPSFSVEKPFVGLELALNGEPGKKFVAESGQVLRADILWQNNMPVKVADLEITARLEGGVYQKNSVAASNGFYDSGSQTIVWDRQLQPFFTSVEPGAKGTSSFSFTILPVATDPALFKNPNMTIHVLVRGKRLDEQGAYQDIVSSFSKEVRIASNLGLVSRLLYNGGPFTNGGPIPPRAETETTYTVTWSLSNSSNGVSDAKITAVLPSYVKWLDKVSPPSEQITYNEVGGELTWRAGDIAAGIGFGTSPREVSFQVSLLPSTSQIGTAPILLGEATATGEDRFTGTLIRSNLRPALTTSSLADSLRQNGGIVVR